MGGTQIARTRACARAHTHTVSSLYHRPEPSSNRRRSSRQHSASSVAAVGIIFIAPPGGRGRGPLGAVASF